MISARLVMTKAFYLGKPQDVPNINGQFARDEKYRVNPFTHH